MPGSPSAAKPDWQHHGIRIVRAAELDSNTPQPRHDSRRRQELFSLITQPA